MDGQTTVIINGKTVGVKFTIYGIQEMEKIKGVSSLSSNILALVWGGIVGNAFAKQIDTEVNFEEVSDWLEGLQLSGGASEEIAKINTAFETSLVYEKIIKPTAEVKEEVAKKKPVGRK